MMGLAGHVAHMGKKRIHTRFWWGNLKERDYLEDLATEGRIILWSIKMEGHGLHSSRCCKHGNEPSGFTKCKEFPE